MYKNHIVLVPRGVFILHKFHCSTYLMEPHDQQFPLWEDKVSEPLKAFIHLEQNGYMYLNK